jgi:uncharacterized protein (TIGR00730 family)
MGLASVTVYCGSRPGLHPEYMAAAYRTGRELAQRGLRLVYGGAKVGTMGEVARGALDAGGTVIGVIPTWLVDREVAHAGLSELHVVSSMHARKQMMSELGDAFIALPGGFGTLEELTEMFTWAQIGMHQKPIGVLNLSGYYDPLVQMAGRMAEDGFMAPEHLGLWVVEADTTQLLDRVTNFHPPHVGAPGMDLRVARGGVR